jgi:hypothetical protein
VRVLQRALSHPLRPGMVERTLSRLVEVTARARGPRLSVR